ncbi:MAG: hypothetical protein QXF12_00830 [Candidatus Aenigmatarchaeota archaeon]
MRLIKEKFYRKSEEDRMQSKNKKQYEEQDLERIMDKLLMERANIYLGKTKISLSVEVPELNDEIIEEFASKTGLDDRKAKEVYKNRIKDYEVNLDPNATSILYMNIENFDYYPGLKDKIIDYISKNLKDGKANSNAIINIEFLGTSKQS